MGPGLLLGVTAVGLELLFGVTAVGLELLFGVTAGPESLLGYGGGAGS